MREAGGGFAAILIAIRAVVISSVVEKSLLQYGNQHVCAILGKR